MNTHDTPSTTPPTYTAAPTNHSWSSGRPVVTAREARRIMLDYLDARVQTATLTELRETTQLLDAALRTSAQSDVLQGTTLMLRGFRDLVFIEMQLRDDNVEAQLQRLLRDQAQAS